MVGMIVRTRQFIKKLLSDVVATEHVCAAWFFPLSLLSFVVIVLAKTLLCLICFVVSIPLHLLWTPQKGFQVLAKRKDNGEFLESYTAFVRHQRLSVLTSIAFILLLAGQIFISTIGIVYFTKPTEVEAYSTIVTLNPTWDITANKDQSRDGIDPECAPIVTTYSCDNAAATALEAYSDNQSANPCPWASAYRRAAMKFSLTSIPDNATITNSELIVNVAAAFNASTPSIIRSNTDGLDALSCTTAGGLWGSSTAGTTYATPADWNTTGVKTVDLGATADSEIQTRLTGSDILPLALSESSTAVGSSISSVDAAANKPQLRVTYTLPPQAPTGTSHSGNATSTVTWTWTDNATADTSNRVHDASHVAVCTTDAASGTGTTVSCIEGTLSANTQYTRHSNVLDADGNTDGPSASAYTSIETPTGLSFSGVTTTGISASAAGTLSNLTSGSSGLYFQESVTSTNSGWTQTNSWPKSGLTANTQYSFQAKARNGDSDETSLTSAATKYTLSVTPNVASTRSPSTWYVSGAFPFTNPAGWGGGGVQYYRYVWDQTATHSFAGTESTWSSVNANCPGGSCTDAGTTLSKTASADGNDWYLHVQAFNGDDTANGNGTNYGPYYFDQTNPTAPPTVNDGTGSDETYTASTTQLSANWVASTDAASGLQKYQYAIGTTSGGTQVLGYTDNGTSASVTKTGLSLTSGTTYYISVRAVDNAGNTGSATSSNGVAVNISLPTITDNQTGDATPRKASGTTYDVDFAKAATGPQLDYAQYAVYSGAGQTGTLIKDWTNIFTAEADSYAANWSVDFASLREGTNYVSVKVVALDALLNELDDAFTVLKDTVAPAITSFTADPSAASVTLMWTTDEPATTQANYGTTASYGSTTTLDTAMATSHTVTIAGLAATTTFHAQALSTDAAGNASASADLSFTTTSLPHTLITNVQVAVNSSTSVTVTWTTNEPATSKVRYGPTTDYGLEVSDTALVTSHSIVLTGLTPGATYHYEVISVGSTTDHDADATFTTTVEVPSIQTAITDVRAVAGETIATLFWTTNEPATSKVRYGPTTAYGSVKSNAKLVTAHELQVAGLEPGTTYHFQLESVGTSTGATADDTFTTNTPESTKNRAIGPTLFAPILNDDGGTKPTMQLSGVAKGGQMLRVYVDGKVVKTIELSGQSTSTKSFAAVVSLKKLKPGKHTLYVQATDEVGRTSIVRQRVTFVIGQHAKGTTVAVKTKAQYVVQPGDSLWAVAERHLGDGRRYVELVNLNAKTFPGLAEHPNIIQPGWTITLPAK